jgi:hypothetical protein
MLHNSGSSICDIENYLLYKDFNEHLLSVFARENPAADMKGLIDSSSFYGESGVQRVFDFYIKRQNLEDYI